MEFMILQVSMAFLGSLGFELMFQLRRRLLLPAAIGGGACWLVYLLCEDVTEGVFLATFAASAFAAVYGEVLARLYKAPATLFVIPALVPLVPGGSLFYTMSYAVNREWEMAGSCGTRTLEYALGIAAGMSLVVALYGTGKNVAHRLARQKKMPSERQRAKKAR